MPHPAHSVRKTRRMKSWRLLRATWTRTFTESSWGITTARKQHKVLMGAVGPSPWSPYLAHCPQQPAWASPIPSESASPPQVGTPVSALGQGKFIVWRVPAVDWTIIMGLGEALLGPCTHNSQQSLGVLVSFILLWWISCQKQLWGTVWLTIPGYTWPFQGSQGRNSNN